MAMVVSSVNNWPAKIGLVTLYFKTEVMFSLFYDIRLHNEKLPYLVDDQGEIIFPYDDTHHLSKSDVLNKESGWSIRGDDIIVNVPIEMLDWKLVGVLPGEQLMKTSKAIEKMFFIVGAVVIGILLIASIYFSVKVTRPINNLFEEMMVVDENDFKKVPIKKQYIPEIKQLYGQFNYMVGRVQHLIEKVYVSKIREKEAELLALQQQINPHFLYNTLDSISWMSLKYQAEDIRHMVMSLASMMRYSLNKGNNLIAVQDELDQVRNYVAIQEIRYDGKFTTSIRVDEEVICYKIIKLIIQPLVENAINHGFKNSGKFGHIDISIKQKVNSLVISVKNDGDEVDLKKIDRLLNPKKTDEPKHYGIRNVNDRLIRQYGNHSALRFSVVDKKTVATITIPVYLLNKGESDE
jgi:two-component system sensor histidine kinase YesM